VEWASSVALSNESSTTLVEAAAPPLDSVQAAELFGSQDKVARDLALPPPPFPFAIMSSSFFSLFFTPPSARNTAGTALRECPDQSAGLGDFLIFWWGRGVGRRGGMLFFFPTHFLMNRERITLVLHLIEAYIVA
jgi:hypothetical protein